MHLPCEEGEPCEEGARCRVEKGAERAAAGEGRVGVRGGAAHASRQSALAFGGNAGDGGDGEGGGGEGGLGGGGGRKGAAQLRHPAPGYLAEGVAAGHERSEAV